MAGSSRGRVGVVAYAFEPARRGALRRALRSLAEVAPWPPGSRAVIVRRAGQPVFGDPGLRLPLREVEHDGRHWEFGAWQCGVEALCADGAPDAWLLLNDTAGVNDPWPRIERQALRRRVDTLAVTDAPALAGAVKHAPPGCAWADRPLPAWVQSHAYGLSAAGLAALSGQLFDEAVFASVQVVQGQLRWPATVSPALAAHISRWLTDPGPHGWRRHSGRTEVPDTLLRDKAGAILLEKRLAALVLAAGGTLHDCSPPSSGPWQQLARRFFYWQRRVGQALPRRRAA